MLRAAPGCSARGPLIRVSAVYDRAVPRALITGIAGQDGSYLAELLLEKGYEVFGVVRGSPLAGYPNLQGIRSDVQLLQADLLDQIALLDAISKAEPDELYN